MATKNEQETTLLTRKPNKEFGENEKDYEEQERIISPDGGWGWIIVIAGFFAHVLSDGVMYAFGVILDELLTVYDDLTAFEVSFVGSLLPAVILGVGPVASSLITLFGPRAVTIAGAIIAGISLMVSAFAPNLVFLSISVGVFCGIGFGIVYLPAIVMVSYYFEKRRSIAMGLTVVGSGIGTVTFPPLLRLLIAEYGWRGTLFILGGVVFNCIACGLVLKPLKPTKVYVKKVNLNNTKSANKHKPATEAEPDSDLRIPLLTGSKFQHSEQVVVLSMPEFPKSKRRFSQSVVPSDVRETGEALSLSSHPRHSLEDPLVLRPDLRALSSLTSIPLCKSNHDLFVPQIFTYALTSKAGSANEKSTQTDVAPKPAANLWAQMVTSLTNSFDCTLFRHIPYSLFCVSSFLTSFGYYAPYLFIVAWGNKELGFPETSAALLSSFIGFGNIAGRLVFGFLGDRPQIPRLLLYCAAMTFCGAVMIISPLYGAYWWMAGVAAGFGFLVAPCICLTPLLLVDMLGLHRLDVAFGVLGFIQCFATLVGPPVLAQLRDMSGSFAVLFCGCGAAIAVSGVMLLPLHFCFNNKLRSKSVTEELEMR